jgi:2,3-bisphosphoglycerate-dependent phosphoglycerate mutase
MAEGSAFTVVGGGDTAAAEAQARAEFGERQVQLWRRSYAVPPPPAADAADTPPADLRYAALPPEARPRAESLRDVMARLLPYWYDFIAPGLRPGATVLVVSHGNTLRALVKHLDAIGDEEIAAVEITHGVPLVYELGPGMRPLSAGRYLTSSSGGPSALPAGRAPERNRGKGVGRHVITGASDENGRTHDFHRGHPRADHDSRRCAGEG